jgi:acetyl-CoA/propionyl-CoA carboxylase biotin carboxyl carrier protein
VRLDAGVEQGTVIGQNFDSLLAKLVVTGATRQQAVERARRALAEFEVDGMATALPFHRMVMHDKAFTPDDPAQPFAVHTRWIESEFDNTIPPFFSSAESPEVHERESVTVEVGGKRLEVTLPAGLGLSAGAAGVGVAAATKAAPRRSAKKGSGAAASGDELTSPMQGTIVKIAVEEGQSVEAGELVVVLEAMKMEQPLNAHKAGIISGLAAEIGHTLTAGASICTIKDV